MKAFEAIGGFGGLVVLITAIVVIGRGIFRQVSVTEDNTDALKELSQQMEKLTGDYQSHEIRISVLEDRTQR